MSFRPRPLPSSQSRIPFNRAVRNFFSRSAKRTPDSVSFNERVAPLATPGPSSSERSENTETPRFFLADEVERYFSLTPATEADIHSGQNSGTPAVSIPSPLSPKTMPSIIDRYDEEVLRSWITIIELMKKLDIKLLKLDEVPEAVDRYSRKGDELPIGVEGATGKIFTYTTRLNESDSSAKVAAKFFRFAIPRIGTSMSSSEVATANVSRQHAEGLLYQAYVEICVMKHPALVDHPNIVTLLGISLHQQRSDQVQLTLLMELANLGSLDLYILNKENQGMMSQKEKISVLRDVANGLHSLHENNIVHNDLKPGNVLLFLNLETQQITAKVADFGWSHTIPSEGQSEFIGPGDPNWASPEAGKDRLSPQRDIYSFGLLACFVFLENSTFHKQKGNAGFLDNVVLSLNNLGVPERVVHSVQGCLQHKTTNRLKHIHDMKKLLDETIQRLANGTPGPPDDESTSTARVDGFESFGSNTDTSSRQERWLSEILHEREFKLLNDRKNAICLVAYMGNTANYDSIGLNSVQLLNAARERALRTKCRPGENTWAASTGATSAAEFYSRGLFEVERNQRLALEWLVRAAHLASEVGRCDVLMVYHAAASRGLTREPILMHDDVAVGKGDLILYTVDAAAKVPFTTFGAKRILLRVCRSLREVCPDLYQKLHINLVPCVCGAGPKLLSVRAEMKIFVSETASLFQEYHSTNRTVSRHIIVRNDRDFVSRVQAFVELTPLPLHIIAQSTHDAHTQLAEFASFVLDNGAKAKLNSRDDYGKSAFWWAVWNENIPLVDVLLEAGFDPLEGNDVMGHTDGNVFVLAVTHASAEIVEKLLAIAKQRFGDELFGGHRQGCTEHVHLTKFEILCIHLFCTFCHTPYIDFCIWNGPYTDKKIIDTFCTLLQFGGGRILPARQGKLAHRTPIMNAVYAGNTLLVKLILKTAIEVEYYDVLSEQDANGFTPLSIAICQKEDPEMFKLLLSLGAPKDVHIDSYRTTVLHASARVHSTAFLQHLIDLGCNLKERDGLDLTVLDYAILSGQASDSGMAIQFIEMILNKDPEMINIETGRDDYRHSPLQRAIYHGRADFISLLIDRGADLSQIPDNALHTAAIWLPHERSRDCVSVLLEKGKVDPNVCDEEGLTALHWAVLYGNIPVVKLLAAKMDITLRTSHGDTALHFALYRKWIYSEAVEGQLRLRSGYQEKVYEQSCQLCAWSPDIVEQYETCYANELAKLVATARQRYRNAFSMLNA